MGTRSSHSHLQNRILLYIEHNKVDSIAGLALKLDAHRSSVSRAMHALEAIGLVSKTNGYWGLSLAGKDEAQGIRCQLPERATKAVETVNRLFDQSRLSAIGSTISSEVVNPYYAAISDAAKVILNTAAQTSIQSLVSSIGDIDSFALVREAAQPLINAVAGIDLLASTEGVMRSLANVVARVDSSTLIQGVTQPLKNTVAGVELITSAQDAMQSVTSVAVRFTSSLNQNANQPLMSAAVRYGPFVSAQDALRPLMDATVRFDSLVLAERTVQSFATLAAGDYSLSLAQKAIQPLISAATRFDSITFGQEITQPLIKTMGEENIQTWLQERSGILPSLNTESLQWASAFGITNSDQLLTSAFEAIKSISLKPTMVEIAASQALQVMGDYSQSIVADIYPHLTYEALTSFSQSQRMSLASIEQVSALGIAGSNILRELSAANLGLSDIISDLGVISAQDHIKTSWAAMMPNVAEVGRTYKGFLADVIGGLSESFVDNRLNVGIAIPTMTTSAYISSVKTAIVADETDAEEVVLPESFPAVQRNGATKLDVVFQSLGPNYITMWQGSWAVLDSNSPDRIRQAAHSGRELLMQVLEKLAPDSAFDAEAIKKDGYGGKVTRKMRIKKILGSDSKSAVGWVDSVAKALDETYDRLAGVSHDRSIHPRATEQQLAGLLYSLGGLVFFIDAFQHRNTVE